MALVNKTFSDIITFSRASTGTFFNSAGVLTSAATNAPRFDYNPSTLAAQGLLIEESRTNSIRNNTMVGAVAGTPGTLPTNWNVPSPNVGLTREIVSVGTQGGINYVDIRFAGTTSGTSANVVFFEGNSSVVAANTQTWTTSCWISVVGGSFANITTAGLITRFNDSGGAFLTLNSSNILTATSTMQRYSVAATASNASTAFVAPLIAFGFANGVAIDITLRIGLPQLELGAFATSVIPTTTTALTRAADVASVNTLSPWYNSVEGTLFADWTSFIPNGTSPGSTYAAGFTDNIASTTAGQLTIQNRAVVNSIRVWQSTTGGGLDDFVAISLTTYFGKAAAAYGGGTNVSASANGGAVVTMTNPIQTTAFNALLLGLLNTVSGTSGGNYLNGHIKRVTYYPRKLSSAELQALTV
jgi:hypothetical protein